MSHTVAIGIDPGKKGGIAVLTDGTPKVYPYSDGELIACIAAVSQPGWPRYAKVCVEKVGARPGQGVVSMFSFGRSLGFIEGALQARELMYQLVPPQTWKKEFSLTGNKADAVEVCRKLFPKVNLLATARCQKPHDGMAEALLMAEYARRKF